MERARHSGEKGVKGSHDSRAMQSRRGADGVNGVVPRLFEAESRSSAVLCMKSAQAAPQWAVGPVRRLLTAGAAAASVARARR